MKVHDLEAIHFTPVNVIWLVLSIWYLLILLLALKRVLKVSLRRAILVSITMIPGQMAGAMLYSESLWWPMTTDALAEHPAPPSPLVLDESFLREEKTRLDEYLASLAPERKGVVISASCWLQHHDYPALPVPDAVIA
ncbi:hypothetical protein [Chitinivorax sp. B]|uniref:hypothetical protein n=1 Tax=Chitinivorax sp. B TaxID=2502235 RepID=UPI0010FA2D20|nr:hypothetical protein [Chitinivorax sp. B]